MGRLKGKNKSKARNKKRSDARKKSESYKKKILAKILKWDEPVLSEKCIAVEKDEDIHNLIKDMGRVISFSKNGVGLAASQIGVTKRVIAAMLDKKNITIFINPEILIHNGDVIKSREMCLSFPNFECVIDRYDTITMRYEDIDRELHTKEFKGFNAIVLQHELGHLREGLCDVGKEWKRQNTLPPVEEIVEQEEYEPSVKVESNSSE